MFFALTLSACLGAAISQTVPCGAPVIQPITNRIVGGQTARPGSWPWMVLLVDDLGFISGSGVVIHPNVILTSAQHFQGPDYSLSEYELHYWRAYAGEYNITVTDPKETYYRLRRAILHPQYNSTNLKNDVALVITYHPIIFNDHTRPACLPDSSHKYTIGEVCYLPGWGSTASTGNEEVLNQVDLPILDDSVCQSEFPIFFTDTEICAGYQNQGKDWCGDDTGSPLMCKYPSGTWYIQGLASSGGDCKKADQPSVFEDVSKYTDWIKQTMINIQYPYQY